MVRNTLKYVANKDMKAFAKDLKTIYTAADEEAARKQLKTVTEKWSGQYREYPKVCVNLQTDVR